MSDHANLIPLDDAAREVAIACRRIALLHLAFARTLVDNLGEEVAVALILRAIKRYGRMVGEEVKQAVLDQGLPLTPENYAKGSNQSLPSIGMHVGRQTIEVDGEEHSRAYGCVMGTLWNDLGERKLGRLYCLVDTAKFMTYNPEFKLVHVKTLPDGDGYCEFCICQTTEQERQDFASENKDWTYIDQCNEA